MIPRSKSKGRGKGGAAAKAAASAPVAQAEGHIVAEQLDREENVDLTLAQSLQLQLQLDTSSGDELLQQCATVPQSTGAAEERPSCTPRLSPKARAAQLQPHLLPPLPPLDLPQLPPPPEEQPDREAEVRTTGAKRKWLPTLEHARDQLVRFGEAAEGASQQAQVGVAAAEGASASSASYAGAVGDPAPEPGVHGARVSPRIPQSDQPRGVGKASKGVPPPRGPPPTQ